MGNVPLELRIARGDTYIWVCQLAGGQKALLPSRTGLWFTLKRAYQDEDSEAKLQITEAGGLVVLNGAIPVLPAWGDLVVDEGNGTVTVTIQAEATALLTSYNSFWHYGMQLRTATAVTTLKRGRAYIVRDVTRGM
jgi:hypothetical protein